MKLVINKLVINEEENLDLNELHELRRKNNWDKLMRGEEVIIIIRSYILKKSATVQFEMRRFMKQSG